MVFYTLYVGVKLRNAIEKNKTFLQKDRIIKKFCIYLKCQTIPKTDTKMSEHIKDQTVNSYNAEIIPQLDTPEKRLDVATTICKRAFNVVGEVEFHHLTQFDKKGDGEKFVDKATIYWTYTFRCEGLVYPGAREMHPEDDKYKLCTITLANYGNVDFNFHWFNVKGLDV